MHFHTIRKIFMKMLTFYHNFVILTNFWVENRETYFKCFPFIININRIHQLIILCITRTLRRMKQIKISYSINSFFHNLKFIVFK